MPPRSIKVLLLFNAKEKTSMFFLSKPLIETEISYAQIEKELLAIITCSCRKLYNYIYDDRDITIFTHQQPLINIIKKISVKCKMIE